MNSFDIEKALEYVKWSETENENDWLNSLECVKYFDSENSVDNENKLLKLNDIDWLKVDESGETENSSELEK